MRNALFGVVLVTVLLLTYTQAQQLGNTVYRAEPVASTTSSSSKLISHFAPSTGGGPHAMVVVDSEARVLAVYHIQPDTGATSLKSVRNLSWDLQMIQFNSENPSPQDVRNGLEQ